MKSEKFLAVLLITSYLLLGTACRSSRHEHTEYIQTSLTDTAHFARIFTTAFDSTATLTWIAIDSFEVQLAPTNLPPRGRSAVHDSAISLPFGGRLVGAHLRLVRAETRSAHASQDSLLAQHQTSELTTSEVSEEQQSKPASTFPTMLTILNLIALAILALILYLYLRQLKTKGSSNV